MDADDNHKTPKKRGGRAGPLSSTYKRKKQEVIDYMDAREAEIQGALHPHPRKQTPGPGTQ